MKVYSFPIASRLDKFCIHGLGFTTFDWFYIITIPIWNKLYFAGLTLIPAATACRVDGMSASGALPRHSLAIDFDINHRYCTFSFTTFSKS